MKNVALLSLLLFIGSPLNLASADQSPSLQDELIAVAPQVPSYVIADAVPLQWETDTHSERKAWSNYSFSVINTYFDQLNGAEDIDQFCPLYETLNRDQQVMTWAQIFVGVATWESSWDPVERTYEDQGIDPQTGLPVFSEGLLQLSYQDVESNPYCPFDWSTDKLLSSTDIHRSILNPYNNLYCGIRTMADLIAQNHRIVVEEGGYWATLQLHHPNSKIKSITAALRKTLPFCGERIKGDSLLKQKFTKFANAKMSRKIVEFYRKLRAKFKHKHKEKADDGADENTEPTTPANENQNDSPAN